jgi:glycosyltransferase involved in cell wall biosynthesis
MSSSLELYLDLMMRCLTDWIYDGANEEARVEGRDWPARAHTMIGLKRLANLRSCVESVIDENVPGDLIETGVWRGGATIFMRAILKARAVTDRLVWVADSFAGLPPPDTARFPSDQGITIFLDLADQVLDRFRPEVLLTYGGHPAGLELMRRARARGIAVVFHLHNFGYGDRRGFTDVTGVIFPSEYSRRHYRRTVGLDGPVIPDPIRLDNVVAAEREPKYTTFINPQPEKGAAVFARIALELGRRRPDIPLLVVEGRGKADGLAGLPVDLSGLTNLNRMANTPDPRDFYRVSRLILMPSLWRESLGRVPIEAMANGIPVLASDRGALPETLGDAGFVFTIPERCTPTSGLVPTAQEVAPWVAVIERLWDDPEFEAEHRRRALAEAMRWDGDRLAKRFGDFFHTLLSVRS